MNAASYLTNAAKKKSHSRNFLFIFSRLKLEENAENEWEEQINVFKLVNCSKNVPQPKGE